MAVDPSSIDGDSEDQVFSVVSKEDDDTTDSFSRRRKFEDPASYLWLVSFTDVMALMLTFFVLLFSMSAPVQQDWAGITDSLQEQFNQYEGPRFEHGNEDAISLGKINYNRALKTAYIESLLQSEWADNETMKSIELIRQADHLVVSIPIDEMFEGSGATIKDEGRKILYAVAGPLSRMKNRIEIEGNIAPGLVRGDDKWSVTMERALSIATVLRDVGYEKNIVVRGNADGRYYNLKDIEDTAVRQAMAQRIDIVIRSDDGERPEVKSDIVFGK